jgi:hypothetical protein
VFFYFKKRSKHLDVGRHVGPFFLKKAKRTPRNEPSRRAIFSKKK